MNMLLVLICHNHRIKPTDPADLCQRATEPRFLPNVNVKELGMVEIIFLKQKKKKKKMVGHWYSTEIRNLVSVTMFP